MPDHVHFINKPKKGFTISDVIQNFSSFTAHEILKQLRKENRRELIDFFRKEALTFQAGTPEIAGKEELTLQAGTPDIAGKRGLRRPEIAGKRKIFSSDSLYPSGRHKTRHKIWRDIQAKNIYSLSFLEQKIEYIHANPCRKKWHLVDERADYKYSSACYYDRGEKPIIEIDDVREIFQ